MHVRYCPACRTDYRPEIAICADCGGPLEDRDDELDASAAPTPGAPTGTDDLPEDFEPIHATRDLDDLTPLADALVAAGIDCRMRSASSNYQVTYRLFVRTQDQAAAAAVLRSALEPQDSGEFDPERGYARCPACDAALAPKAHQCLECGLLLGPTQTACSECGAPIEADAERCEKCGAAAAAAD